MLNCKHRLFIKINYEYIYIQILDNKSKYSPFFDFERKVNKNKNIVKNIIEQFGKVSSFTRAELYDFYKQFQPELKYQTFSWYIYALKRKNIINEIKSGLYQINGKKIYSPLVDEKMEEIYSKVSKEFYQLNLVIWSTRWINDFSLHLTFHNFYILETEREYSESLFNKMKELNIPNVFLNPDDSLISKYVIGEDEPFVIKNLISKSPNKKFNQIKIPTLEKILVDLFCDKKTFYMYQGHEMKEIFRSAISGYTINFTKLFHYARRRGKEEEIRLFLSQKIGDYLQGILDD